MKLFLIAITPLFIIFLTGTSYATHAMQKQSPLLVLDMRNIDRLPKNFRTSADNLPKDAKINRSGLDKLHMAGSGQFSSYSLKQAVDKMRAESILIIDLRQESHGFLNGNAVSWYADNNGMNQGKDPQLIELEQPFLLGSIQQKETILVDQILKKNAKGHITVGKPVEFAVHQVMSEAELMHQYRFGYERIYVQDHHAPSDGEVDRFINIINQTPNDTWVYFHCRAGMGRTSTFMLMYDIMHNAKELSFQDLLLRQAILGGKDLARLPAISSFKYKAAKERLGFLQKFYQYANENRDEFETSWSEWLISRGELPMQVVAKPASESSKIKFDLDKLCLAQSSSGISYRA